MTRPTLHRPPPDRPQTGAAPHISEAEAPCPTWGSAAGAAAQRGGAHHPPPGRPKAGAAPLGGSAAGAAAQRGGAQSGAALLAAMVTVALVATLATAALWRQWRGVEVEAAERARVQSAWLLTGALDWGRLLLAGDRREDRKKKQYVDHLGEPWSVPLAEARLSTFLAAGEASTDTDRDAFLSGQVTDLQSRLNVMNLLVGDGLAAYQRFERLFNALGLRSGELATLRDNLQRADAAMQDNRTGADTSDTTDALLMPRRFDQLAWLGLSADTLDILRPYVTVLPVTSGNNNNPVAVPVNLNTASALVIYAANLSIDEAGAQRLVAQRQSQYFENVATAVAQISGMNVDATWQSVNSSYFEVRGRLRLDDVALEEFAVVRRSSSGVSTLWRERAAVVVPDGP
ncbi:type II secretion system minor pseudopilin GspK [Ottowia sp.]|uniref:type II secretion system minor pseudopilin GspK n=1 Tax=Ottowia sp. TaxID=1898956 RepID=UPI003A84EE2F